MDRSASITFVLTSSRLIIREHVSGGWGCVSALRCLIHLIGLLSLAEGVIERVSNEGECRNLSYTKITGAAAKDLLQVQIYHEYCTPIPLSSPLYIATDNVMSMSKDTLMQEWQRSMESYDTRRDPSALTPALLVSKMVIMTGLPFDDALMTLTGRLLFRLHSAYLTTGQMRYIDHGIEIGKCACTTSEASTTLFVGVITNFSQFLLLRHEKSHDIQDLEDAAVWGQSGLDACGKHSIEQRVQFPFTVGLYKIRNELFRKFRTVEKLELVLSATRKILEFSALSQDDRREYSAQLGRLIGDRSDLADTADGIDEGIKSLEFSINGEMDLGTRCQRKVNLSNCYDRRFVLLGNPEDLTRAIELSQDAWKWPGPDLNYRFHTSYALARRLRARFEHKFALKDLEASQDMFGRALECLKEMPQAEVKGHIASTLLCLGFGSWRLYERTHDDMKKKELLDEASQNVKKVVQLQEAGGQLPLQTLTNLSNLMGALFTATGDSKLLDQAEQLAVLSVNRTGPNDLNRVRRLRSLGRAYTAKGDYGAAIKAFEESIEKCTDDHIRAVTLHDLADCYSARALKLVSMFLSGEFEIQNTKSQGEEEKALGIMMLTYVSRKAADAYFTVLQTPSRPMQERVYCGSAAGLYFGMVSAYDEMYDALSFVMELLPELSNRFLTRSDQQDLLGRISMIPPRAAYAAILKGLPPVEVVTILEKGRGVIAGLISNFRSEAPGLKDKYPELWRRYFETKKRLSKTETDVGDEVVQVTRKSTFQILQESQASLQRQSDTDQLTSLETEIRQIPEYSNFLNALTELDFLALAQNGPIVTFNITTTRCDAFMITAEGVSTVSLPGFSDEVAQQFVSQIIGNNRLSRGPVRTRFERNQKLRATLQDLWLHVVHPILEALDLLLPTKGESLPRLWWIASGVMGLLPLHAAGIYSERGVATEYTSRYVTSSYSPTIKALSIARQTSVRPLSSPSQQILIIAMRKTVGKSGLKVDDEITAIRKSVNSLDEEDILVNRSKKDVMRSLDHCTVAHFACHGVSDVEDPSSSALLLGTESAIKAERLTVNDLASISLYNAQIAYLSACSTAQNAAPLLVNEMIHIASTFQLMGFSHVVGTLWEVGDKAAIKTTERFYGSLVKLTEDGEGRENHDAVAFSVAAAAESLRKDKPQDFLSWVPFIHFGA